MKMGSWHVGGLLCVSLAGGVGAQTLRPDAGVLQQKPQEAAPLPKPAPEGLSTAPDKPSDTPPDREDAQQVWVKGFDLEGATWIPMSTLQARLKPFVDRRLKYADLRLATAEIIQAYREAGYLVRVVLPPQEVRDGRIRVQVVEARLGKVVVETAPDVRVPTDLLARYFQNRLQAQEPLRFAPLDRALLLADDLAGVSVAARLEPGQAEGQTDVRVSAQAEPTVVGEVGVDQAGARATGLWRAKAAVEVASPWQAGGVLSTQVTVSEGLQELTGRYHLPVGNDGWRVGATVSGLHYSVVAPEFAGLNARGRAQSWGLQASYPWLRSRSANATLLATADRKHLHNRAQGEVQSEYRIDTWGLQVQSQFFDAWGGGGANAISLGYTQGRVNWGRWNLGETPGSARSFYKWRYALSRQQSLSTQWSVLARLWGQAGSNQLDSAERFYLGGAQSVRAYPTSEGGGVAGQVAQLELRARLHPQWLFTLFYDQGQVKTTLGRRVRLSGWGVGAQWQGAGPWRVSITAARPVGTHPLAVAGKNQDGSRVGSRVWLDVAWTF